MSLLKKFAGETVIYGISSILPKILHFLVFTIYLTYKFPETEDFGIYTFLYGYVAVLIVIFTLRMDTAFFRFGSRDIPLSKAFGTASIPVIFVSVLAGSLIYFNAPFLSQLINFPGNEKYVQWFAFILAFDAITALPFARMRLSGQARKFLFYRLLNVILTLLFVFTSLELIPRIGTDAMIASMSKLAQLDYVFLANLFASAIVFLLMSKEYLSTKLEFDPTLFKKMLVYVWPLIFVGIAAGINQAFAVPLQTIFLGEDQMENIANAGVYAAAAKIAILLSLATTAFNYAAEPFFFNQYQNADSKKIYGTVGLAYTIIACFILLGIILYTDVFILLIGPEYRAAVNVVPILLYAYLFLGLYYNFSIWYKLVDKTYFGAIISVTGAIITLIISIILLPKIGDIASAWAALACYVTMSTMGLYFGRKHFKIEYPIGKMSFYIFTSLIIFGISVFFKSQFEGTSFLVLGVNTLLLISFVAIVWKTDRILIKELIT